MDFKPKLIRRDKEGHFILPKGIIHHQDITIVNICTSNDGESMYVKQILVNFKNQIDHNTIILDNFYMLLTLLGRASKQNLNKEATKVKNTIANLDLTDIYGVFPPIMTEYTFFSAVHTSFSHIDHVM